MSDIFQVPIAKGGKGATVEVDIKLLNDEMYALVMAEGLKAVLNARMTSKAGPGAVTKLSGKDLDDAHDRAMRIAQENRAKLMAGEVKSKSHVAKSDLPREVTTEARRIARELVKNEIRKAGQKPSHYAASDITKAADAMIAADSTIIAKALENIASRADLGNPAETKEEAAAKLAKFGVAEDPKKLAKAAKDAAERKSQLSAKQAGLPKGMAPPRKKPPVELHTTH